MNIIPIDKQAHFWAGAAIAGLMVAYGVSPIIGFCIAVLAGIAKEIVDSLGYGTPDIKDAIATGIGGALVLPILLL